MQTLDALLPSNAGERKTLADIILAKLDGGEANPTAMIQKVQQGQYCVIIQS
jgi:essential nuclear protein 1